MVSEFRKNKIIRGLEFFDADKSGNVNKADFELATKKIGKARGLQESDEKFKKLSDFILKVWEGIKKEADSDNDDNVTSAEWLALWDKFAKNPSPPEWQNNLCKSIFSVLDAGNDGQIDKDEFIGVTTSFGRTNDDATTAFGKISKGKATVSYEEFQALFREYFASDDVNAAGNFIFGRTKF